MGTLFLGVDLRRELKRRCTRGGGRLRRGMVNSHAYSVASCRSDRKHQDGGNPIKAYPNALCVAALRAWPAVATSGARREETARWSGGVDWAPEGRHTAAP